jgi:hypothetical protein
METLRFGQLPNYCDLVKKECRLKSEYCITTKKVQKLTYLGEIFADEKGT